MKLYVMCILVLLVVILSACGQEAECQSAADCPSSGECFIPVCQDGMCSSVSRQNCCGNNVCEAGENVCSCPADCRFEQTSSGLCEGKVSTTIPNSQRSQDAQFTQWYCADQGCVAGVPPGDVQTLILSSDHGSSIRFQLTVSMSKPYVIGTGVYSARVSLLDFDSKTIARPIRVTKIQVLSGTQLIGERDLQHSFTGIGDSVDIPVDISIVLDRLEQDRSFSTRIYYEYQRIRSNGELETVRTSFERSHSTHSFVDPNKV